MWRLEDSPSTTHPDTSQECQPVRTKTPRSAPSLPEFPGQSLCPVSRWSERGPDPENISVMTKMPCTILFCTSIFISPVSQPTPPLGSIPALAEQSKSERVRECVKTKPSATCHADLVSQIQVITGLISLARSRDPLRNPGNLGVDCVCVAQGTGNGA